jgi:hypothetical protein
MGAQTQRRWVKRQGVGPISKAKQNKKEKKQPCCYEASSTAQRKKKRPMDICFQRKEKMGQRRRIRQE